MPIIKSSKKSLRVGQRRKVENDLVRSKIKSAVKGAKLSIAAKKEDVAEKLETLYRELDLAAKKNVIHRNKAARLKSRITKSADKAEAPVAKKKTAAKAKAKKPATKKK